MIKGGDESSKPTAIFDIDGTIANVEHRRHFVTAEKADWASFNEAMGDDTVNEAIVSLYKTLWNSEVYQLILVSGRSETYRNVTEAWLTWNEIPFSRLLMRGSSDTRSDEKVKAEILRALRAEGHRVLFAVDDRQKVVDMWRSFGVTCLQCDVGDF